MHHFGHFLGVEAFGLLGSLLHDFNSRVAIQRIGFRVELLGFELLDDSRRFRALARVRREGHQRALHAVAANRGELVRGDAVARHHHGVDALITHLAHDQPAFSVQAAPVDDFRAGCLDLRDNRRKVLLAEVDAVIQHFLDAGLVHGLLRLVGEALAVGGLVMHDSDLLALQRGGDIGGGDSALLVVTAAGAELVPVAGAVGQLRVGCRRGDRQRAVFLVDIGGRDRHARIEVPDDVLDAVRHKLVGN